MREDTNTNAVRIGSRPEGAIAVANLLAATDEEDVYNRALGSIFTRRAVATGRPRAASDISQRADMAREPSESVVLLMRRRVPLHHA